MVQDAKAVAIDTNDAPAVSRWRESNRAVSNKYLSSVQADLNVKLKVMLLLQLLNSVGQVRKAVTVNPDLPPPDISQMRINDGE